MPDCALCLLPKPLRRSHILPDLVYKPSYDDKHRIITFDGDEERRGLRHTGYWEELLCHDCEGRFARWETYFADVWFNRSLRPVQLQAEFVTITGLDYRVFKLFHISILWRAGVASFDFFKQIRLGSHQERMRQRLLSEDPGPPDLYPLTGIAVRDPNTHGFRDDLIALPGYARIAGHTVYRALFGGVFWHYAISSHRSQCPVPATLRSDGSLELLVQDWTRNPAIRQVAAQLRRLHRSGD